MGVLPTLAESTFLATGLVSLGYILFAGYIMRRFDQIGVRSLSLFSIFWGMNFIVSTTVVYLLYGAGFRSGAELVGLSFSRNVELFLIVSSPIRSVCTIGGIFSWFWFVYEYTTRPRRRDEFLLIGLSSSLVVLASIHGLIGALRSFGYIQLPAVLRGGPFFEFVSLLEILGTGIAIGIGTAQLFRTARRHPPFVKSAAAALSLPIVFPYLLRYLYQFNIIPQFQTIQFLRFVALSLGLGGLLLAVHKYQLFDQLPAAQAMGRDLSFDTTGAAITVLDDNDRISDLNPAAEDLFGISKTTAIGQSLTGVLPVSVDGSELLPVGRHTFEMADSGTIVEAETTQTTDERDREFGRVIAYRDITEERRRQQRIQVLNRVLRHNLRNRLMVVEGHVEIITAEMQSDDEHVSKVNETLDELVSMGAKAGQAEKILQADREVESSQSLGEIIQRVLTELEKEYETITVDVDVPDSVTTSANPLILESILTELVMNAIEHTSDAAISIELAPDGSGVVVSDTGPGIPEHEIEVFVTGEETPLQHGSGLGLWLVKWGVGRLGGSLDFETDASGRYLVPVGRINDVDEHIIIQQ